MSDTVNNEFKKLDRSDRLLEDAKKPKKARAINSYRIVEAEQKKIPQAVVKITSYLSGQKSASNHLYYISRSEPYEKKGSPIALEDERGNLVEGKEAIKDLINEWRVDFARDNKPQLEALKIAILQDDVTAVIDLLEAAKAQAIMAYPDHEIRADRGRYEATASTVFVTIKQRHLGQELPAIESIQEDFEKRFPQQIVRVDNVKKYQQRDTANIMFSTPGGSDPEAVRKAVRDTATAYFGEKGFRYVFALHTDTEKPHVHVSVKTVNELTGKRLVLNPRDIQHLRALFVEKSREQGIVMTSSLRYQRGLAKHSRSLPEIKMQDKALALGQGLDKYAKLREEVKTELAELKASPLKRALFDYRQKLKTADDYRTEIKNLKDGSFTEINPDKKQLYITLYKALEKDMEKRLSSKSAQLNERVRKEYIEDVAVLRDTAKTTSDQMNRAVLEAMADKLAQYAKDMPQPQSEKDTLVTSIQRAANKPREHDGPEL